MKDLDDFDIDESRDEDGDDAPAPGLDIEDDAGDEPEEWSEGGPSRLADEEGALPDLPPDVAPERPLIPPLTYLLLVLVAVPIVLYVLLRPSGPEPVAGPDVAATPLGVAPTPTPEPEATDAAPALELPALDASDGAVRELLSTLSAHEGLAAWLGQEQLVRTFVVAVENVADGESPAPHLGFLAPKSGFSVRETPRGPAVDPASFARYDAVTGVLTSLDADRVAARLRDLKPLTDAAYRELGHPEGSFSETLRRALDRLIATPVPAAGALLRRHSVTYAWEDPRLETLDPAQKHLLRTGPRNQAAIQAWLKSLRAALSPPPEAATKQPGESS